jgi:hypothetical protein
MKGYIMAHIDIKKTTWERITVSDEDYVEILAKFKAGDFNQVSDICGDYEFEIEGIDDTDEEMYPDDNKGNPTIELFKENGADADWGNGY